MTSPHSDRIRAHITKVGGKYFFPICDVRCAGFTLTDLHMGPILDLMPNTDDVSLRVTLSEYGYASVTISKGEFLLALGETL